MLYLLALLTIKVPRSIKSIDQIWLAPASNFSICFDLLCHLCDERLHDICEHIECCRLNFIKFVVQTNDSYVFSQLLIQLLTLTDSPLVMLTRHLLITST